MRQLSLDGIRSLLAEETESVWCFGVSFHPNVNEPAESRFSPTFLVNNNENIQFSDGAAQPSIVTYTALPFEVTLASDNEDSVPQVKLKVDNISQAFSLAIRQTQHPPTVKLRMFRLRRASPESPVEVNLEFGPSRFTMLSATVNAFSVEGVLGFENDFLNEPAVQHRFTPSMAPALFS